MTELTNLGRTEELENQACRTSFSSDRNNTAYTGGRQEHRKKTTAMHDIVVVANLAGPGSAGLAYWTSRYSSLLEASGRITAVSLRVRLRISTAVAILQTMHNSLQPNAHSREGSGPSPNTRFDPWTPTSPRPERLDRFSQGWRSWPTDKHTDRPRYMYRPHMLCAMRQASMSVAHTFQSMNFLRPWSVLGTGQTDHRRRRGVRNCYCESRSQPSC